MDDDDETGGKSSRLEKGMLLSPGERRAVDQVEQVVQADTVKMDVSLVSRGARSTSTCHVGTDAVPFAAVRRIMDGGGNM